MAVRTYLQTALSISIFLAAIGGAAASQPTQATNPNPADGAIDLSVEANLSWVRGEGVLEDEVYFGTDPCALPKVAHIIVLPMNPPLYNPGDPNLIASTTYYWQVVEVNGPDTYEGPVWEFATVRGEAQPSYPIDGALIKGDIVSGNVSTNLEFIPGATAVEHTGYFSDDYSKVESRAEDANLGPPPYGYISGYEYTFWVGNSGVPPADETLVRGTKYYWTVDETDALGNTFAGDIWEFTIQDFKAIFPNPPNEATFVGTDVLLSWQPGYGVQEHDIYMSTSWEDVNSVWYSPFFPPPPEYLGTTTEPNILVTGLLDNTRYYWRVDEVNGRYPPFWMVTLYKGPVWCFTTEPEGVGMIRMDLWWNISCPPPCFLDYYYYPNSPDETRFLTSFDSGTHLGEDYGGMIYGWLHPAKSGDYTFWLCSDDDGDLFLSTDERASNMERIAYVRGFVPPYNWYHNPSQQSAPISLVAGQKYYIMSRWQEGGGGDHCMVAWQGPDQPLAPVNASSDAVIPGSRLSLFVQYLAHNPDPRDGQTDVMLPVNLKWEPGDNASEHNVYIGTNFNAVENAFYDPRYSPPTEFLATTTEPNLLVTGLDLDTMYYWRVDEIDPSPLPPSFPYVSYYKGDVWSFTTEVNRIFVDIDATGANDGTSWANAYNYLQDALADANSGAKPVKIMVAQGIYKPDKITPGDGLLTFQLKNGVAIKGGYAGFGEANPNARDIDAYETILSGYMCFGELCYNSCHVVTSIDTDETAVLDGFTITGGNADCWYENDYGGGIYNDSGSPTISNCTFTGNTAFNDGGGMYNSGGNPTLTNCTFIHNGVGENTWDGTSDGGGMYNAWGSPKLTNCIFIGNMSMVSGGGMRNYGGSPTLTNCRFIGNFAFYGGGGGMYSAQSTATLNNCIFIGNSAGDYGGGMYNTQGDTSSFINCTFSANSAARYGGTGGGMFSTESSTPTLSNCIFRGNSDSGGINESAQVHGGSPVVNYSSVQGWTGSLGGTGNTGADPMFVREPNDGGDGWCDDLLTPDVDEGANDDFGDVHLLPGSPCIETGDPNFMAGPNDVDIDGHPRIIDGDCNGTAVVDMGAYEFNYAYMGDFDYNCRVDFADFSMFGLAWTSQPGDFNWDFACDIGIPADNVINKLDLAAFVDNWLAGF